MSGRLIRSYLRRARRRANKTQKQLISQISVSLRKYISIEGGQADPTPSELERIAKVLGENIWETQRSEEEYLRERRRFHRANRRAQNGKNVC